MNQQIIDYLQQNKDKYPLDVLVQQLRIAGYAECDIQAAIGVGDGPEKSNRIKIILAILLIVFVVLSFGSYYLSAFFNGGKDRIGKHIPTEEKENLKNIPPTSHVQGDEKPTILSGNTVMFNGYEVPAKVTQDFNKTLPVSDYKSDFEKNLELWRQATQKINKIDDSYFNQHIFVDKVEIVLYDGNKSIYIGAHLKIDWAKVGIGDRFKYNLAGVSHDITLEELVEPYLTEPPFYNSQTDANKFWFESDISEITPLTHIVTKEQLESTISKIAPSGSTYDIKVYRDEKRPVVSVFGKIDEGDNRCFSARIYLDTGETVDASEVVCRYTD